MRNTFFDTRQKIGRGGIDVREQHWSKRSVEKRTWWEFRIVSFASSGEKDGEFLLFSQVIMETVMEEFHSQNL